MKTLSEAQRRVLQAIHEGKRSHFYIFRKPSTQNSYSRTMDAVERHGLVEYYEDPDPQKGLRLTDKGRELLAATPLPDDWIK